MCQRHRFLHKLVELAEQQSPEHSDTNLNWMIKYLRNVLVTNEIADNLSSAQISQVPFLYNNEVRSLSPLRAACTVSQSCGKAVEIHAQPRENFPLKREKSFSLPAALCFSSVVAQLSRTGDAVPVSGKMCTRIFSAFLRSCDRKLDAPLHSEWGIVSEGGRERKIFRFSSAHTSIMKTNFSHCWMLYRVRGKNIFIY